MPLRDLPYRQVHLDFHTSPDIPGIAADFDPDTFADTLARAHVNSVTVFARCHHGHLYFDSKRHPERIHPNLANRGLLKQQIEACQARGIRTPIYITVQWDKFTARQHPEWLCVDDGGFVGHRGFHEAGFYETLDVLHPGYRQFLKDHTAEVFELLPVDGLFFDIVQPKASHAPHWLDAMDEAGVDPEDDAAVKLFAAGVIDRWKLEMTRFIEGLPQHDPERCSIFYNAGHVGPRHRSSMAAYTHYELESLPSGGWGYLHFPLAMRFARGLGKQTLGMTGKFHTSWGDFHSFKNRAALEFECFHMIALGAVCSVGDQLHPRGEIDPATYDLIGSVYGSVAAKEPWCRGAQPVTEIGVLTPEEFGTSGAKHVAQAERQPDAAMGAVRMLQELGRQFDILTTDRDWAPYKLLILPDEIPVDPALARKLSDYLDSGGAIVASWASGLHPRGDAFSFNGLGVKWIGPAPYSPDFLVPGDGIGAGLPKTGHAMYERGMRVEALGGAQVLAQVQTPYFNRSWRHFCSHRHTPSAGQVGYPGIVRQDACIYFAHPIFRQYRLNAPRWCRALLGEAIDQLIGPALVQTDGPSTLINALNHQPHEHRHVLHLIHYIPERRGDAFDIIEDVIPLHDLGVSLALAHKPEAVRLIPEAAALPFEHRNGRLTFTVPRIHGHAMIEIT
ncbi:MAG: beta-galactosidase [Planctomycetes bacterium]|jgi:hypothetical protein|nr:beta-galactosidase [Planctomycetota bacterium]